VFSAHEMDRFRDHGILIPRDVGAARVAQVKDAIDVGPGLWTGEITCHKTAKVFGQGDPEIIRALPRASLHLVFQGNLGSRHHDVTIITQQSRSRRKSRTVLIFSNPRP
jgi:hypothetical protein